MRQQTHWQRIGMIGVVLVLLSSCTSIRPHHDILDRENIGSGEVFSYSSYAEVLKTYVDENGLVDYQNLVLKPELLNQFYGLIATFSPDSHPHLFPTDNDRLAYWLNAYNATAMRGVVEYYPISSVADIEEPALLFFFPSKSGFFFFQRFTFGGQETSLYYLENSVIRGRFAEPRIHFALNCASLGCPELPQTPFYPASLEQQLENETVKFINDQAKVRFSQQENVLYLSSIFQWFSNDFTTWMKKNHPDKDPTLLEYVLLYLNPDTVRKIMNSSNRVTVDYLPYDWGLNDQR